MTNVKKFTAKVTALLLALSLALLSVPQVSLMTSEASVLL